MKTCVKCKKIKPVEKFFLKPTKRIARRNICMVCDKKRNKKLRKNYYVRLYDRNRRENPIIRERMLLQAKSYGCSTRGRANRLYLAAKHRAKTHNLEFTITQDFIEEILIIGYCQRTAIPFDFSSPTKGRFNPHAPSLDKKDCFKGYTKENTQVVCNAYNLAKHQMTDEEFFRFCKIVLEKNS